MASLRRLSIPDVVSDSELVQRLIAEGETLFVEHKVRDPRDGLGATVGRGRDELGDVPGTSRAAARERSRSRRTLVPDSWAPRAPSRAGIRGASSAKPRLTASRMSASTTV